jgi:hypothetical protein
VFGSRFKGSDDYLRTKFEEYVSAALASVRYRDFVAKGEVNGVMITGGSGSSFSQKLVSLILHGITQAETQIQQKTSTPYGSPNSKKQTLLKFGIARQTRCYLTSSSLATRATRNQPSCLILDYVSRRAFRS